MSASGPSIHQFGEPVSSRGIGRAKTVSIQSLQGRFAHGRTRRIHLYKFLPGSSQHSTVATDLGRYALASPEFE